MAFNANNIITQNPNLVNSNILNKQEIEILFELIKKSNFLGEHIETVYNMVIKLQNQYLEQK